MRIAVIGTPGGSPTRDGVNRALGEIYPRLLRRGHDVDIFSERNGRAVTPIAGARMIQLPSIPFAPAEAGTHAMLASLVGAFGRYDIVNFVAADAAALFNIAAKIGTHRTVVSVHGLGRAAPWPCLSLGAEATAARFADVITVVSRRLERFFRDAYGRETIYIPNGVSPQRPDASSHVFRTLGLEPGRYVLAADRMVHSSGLVQAAQAMRGIHPGWKLVVVETGEGDDQYRHSVRQEAGTDGLLLLGSVAEPLLDALMSHAYLYLLPSLADEPAPMLMKALGHGTAVAVSDLPEHLDVVGADGFTFTSGDQADLRRVLTWLLNDPEVVTRMRVRSASAAATRYCWDRIADAYEQLYSSIV